MVAIRLKAIITEDRQLKVDLPEDIPPGEVEIILEVPPTWTDEELQALHEEMEKIKPQTGAEIAAWRRSLGRETGWEHIEDGAQWVEEQRRKQRERNQW